MFKNIFCKRYQTRKEKSSKKSETSEEVFKLNPIDWGGGVENPSSGYILIV